MRAASLFLALGVLLAAPAAGANPDPRSLVLRQSDVPAGFRFDRQRSGIRTNALEAQGDAATAAFFTRAGRVVGYVATYRRRDRDVGVTSKADVFRAASGARMMLGRSERMWRQLLAGVPRSRVGVGAGGWLYAGSIDTFVFWRHGRVFASIMGIGMGSQQALALARAQQRRVAAALR